ncbi:MAG: endonuclease III [Spirochaetales bacterium]|nr:endonuclease III [Spirochaetales bacterium]
MDTSKEEKSKRALEILSILESVYPDPKPLLDYTNAFELLIATILAAQCTDGQVNKVTPALFKTYPDARNLAAAPLPGLETIIRSTGFYRNKAKAIKNASAAIVERFGGEVPQSIDEMASLPGCGRKTANVVAGHCFGIPAIMVDTHLKRVADRLSLSTSANPDRIERELREIIPEEKQTGFSLHVNYHGRYRCKAKKPLCPECEITRFCPYPNKTA